MIISTMVVNNLIRNLQHIGLSEYEARAYTALLDKNPATGYEVAKASGIPTSKIYEVLSRLSEKDIVSSTSEKGTKKYIPIDTTELIESRQKKLNATFKALNHDLKKSSLQKRSSHIWNVSDYDYAMDKAERMILAAQHTLLVSAWKDEIVFIEDFLKTAEIKGVRIGIIHFGKPRIQIGKVYQHSIEESIYFEKGGRGIVIVADSEEVLMAFIEKDNRVQGAWSRNRGYVSMAEDYIKHDIYFMKIAHRFAPFLREKFGGRYEQLRDIFSDTANSKNI
jgi:sugar-specific transcriptional regulator TrmB